MRETVSVVTETDLPAVEKLSFETIQKVKKLIMIISERVPFEQIADVPNSFLAVDDTEVGHANRIPLWMFGFIY